MPQRHSRRRAALSTLFGTGATVAITIAQAFILIPLCLTYLGGGLYGAWLAASELLVWLQLLDLGIPNLMTQRIGASVGQMTRGGVALVRHGIVRAGGDRRRPSPALQWCPPP